MKALEYAMIAKQIWKPSLTKFLLTKNAILFVNVNQPDSPNCVFTKNVDLFTSIKRTSRMDFYKNQMKG